jgi:hypothetical protein
MEVQNIQDIENKIIKRRHRPLKEERFVKERQDLIEKLNMIIGINDKNNSVFLYELEKEIVKQKVRENIPLIQKYYKCGSWNYFKNRENASEVGLIKSVYNNSGYIITSKKRVISLDDKKKQCNELYFIKSNK